MAKFRYNQSHPQVLPADANGAPDEEQTKAESSNQLYQYPGGVVEPGEIPEGGAAAILEAGQKQDDDERQREGGDPDFSQMKAAVERVAEDEGYRGDNDQRREETQRHPGPATDV